MFRVSFFCDDRKLAAALRAMMGIAVGAPEVLPVGDKPANGTGKRGPQGASLVPQLADYLRTIKPTELRLADIKEWLQKIGRNPTNAQHVARLATKRGLLQREGEGRDTIYKVVTNPAPIPIAKANRRGVRLISRRRRVKR